MKLPFYLKSRKLAAFFSYRRDDIPFCEKVKDSKFNQILRLHKAEMIENSTMSANAAVIHHKAVAQVKHMLNNSYKVRNVNAKTMKCDATTVVTRGARQGIDWIDDVLSSMLFAIDDIYTIDFSTDIKEEWLSSIVVN